MPWRACKRGGLEATQVAEQQWKQQENHPKTHFSQQNKKKHKKTHIKRKKTTFFEIGLDEISYETPYLQVCTEKKKCLKIFFLREISSAAPIIGTFLYYARCVNSTMLAALGSLATQQANPIENRPWPRPRNFLTTPQLISTRSSPTTRATWSL